MDPHIFPGRNQDRRLIARDIAHFQPAAVKRPRESLTVTGQRKRASTRSVWQRKQAGDGPTRGQKVENRLGRTRDQDRQDLATLKSTHQSAPLQRRPAVHERRERILIPGAFQVVIQGSG